MSKFRGKDKKKRRRKSDFKSSLTWDTHLRVDMRKLTDVLGDASIKIAKAFLANRKQGTGARPPALSKQYKKRLRNAGFDTKNDMRLTGGLVNSLSVLLTRRKEHTATVIVGASDATSKMVNVSKTGARRTSIGEPYSVVASILAFFNRKLIGSSKKLMKLLTVEVEKRVGWEQNRKPTK